MSVEIYGQMASVALVASFCVAIGCVIAGLRERKLSRRLAWVCVASIVVVLVTAVTGYLMAMSAVFATVAATEPSAKAAMLATGISEAMNCAAFFAIAVLPPALASVFLFVRDVGRRAPGQV